MNLFAPQHLIPLLVIVLLLFGRGRISEFMGDFAKGIKSFRKGLKDDDNPVGEEIIPAERERIGVNRQKKPRSPARKTVSGTSSRRSSGNRS